RERYVAGATALYNRERDIALAAYDGEAAAEAIILLAETIHGANTELVARSLNSEGAALCEYGRDRGSNVSPSAKMRVVPTLPIHWRVVECLGGLEAMAIIPVALPLQRSRAVRSPQRPSIMSLTSWAGSQGPLMFNHAVL